MDGLTKILVVDDESAIRFLLSDVLLSRGFEVSTAKDGQESLEQLERNDFDLVITDINMPRLDGISMLKRMKKARRKEKIIVMTAKPIDQQLLAGDMPQVLTRLSKPFKMDNFLDVVISAVSDEKRMPQTTTGCLA
ncbi:MAG: response regulator [Thermodesulfobacteriota bacterium]|nr:response regulator [Thermodesulfobacteriota bacterium]